MQGKDSARRDREESKEKDVPEELSELELKWKSAVNKITKFLWTPSSETAKQLHRALHSVLLAKLAMDGAPRKELVDLVLEPGEAMWMAIAERPSKEVSPQVTEAATKLNNLFVDVLKNAGHEKEAGKLAEEAENVLKKINQ